MCIAFALSVVKLMEWTTGIYYNYTLGRSELTVFEIVSGVKNGIGQAHSLFRFYVNGRCGCSTLFIVLLKIWDVARKKESTFQLLP